MSYLDTRSRPSTGSMAAVVAVHAAGGLALIYGLTVSGVIKQDDRIITIPFKDPPPPPEPPKPQPDQRTPVDKPIVVPVPPIPLPMPQPTMDTTDRIQPPLPPVPPGNGELVEKVLPSPTPTPSFVPVQAKPRNDPRGWIGTDDYRTNWLRQEWTGQARFRLDITAEGRVADCTIVASTGHADMDAATCALIQRRAKFQPGRGSNGEAVASSYTGSVFWKLPED